MTQVLLPHMPHNGALALFMVAALSLNFMPGPDMMYVAARSIGDGRTAGIASALGIAGGTLFHIVVVSLGLATLLRTVPNAYLVIRLVGGLYLIYLGLRALGSTKSIRSERLAAADMKTVFWQGALTNILNPKVALFFLAFLPHFVDPRGNITLQIVFLGLLFDASGTAVNLGVAYVANGATTRLARPGESSGFVARASGALLIALGIYLTWTGLAARVL